MPIDPINTGGADNGMAKFLAQLGQNVSSGNYNPNLQRPVESLLNRGLATPGEAAQIIGSRLPATPLGNAYATGAVTADELAQQAALGYDRAATGVRALAPRAAATTAATTAATAAETAGAGATLGETIAAQAPKAGMLASLGAGYAPVALGAVGSIMGGNMIDKLNIGGENSGWDRFLPAAFTGAGLGGAAALAFGGPVGLSALAGLAIMGGIKYLTGDKMSTEEQLQRAAQETRTNIVKMSTQYGLDNESMKNVVLAYDAATDQFIANKDKDGLKNYIAQMAQQLPTLMGQQQQEQNRFKKMIQLQAQFGPIFSNMALRSSQSNQVAYEQALSAADAMANTNPQLSAVMRSQAAQAKADADRLLAGYAEQVTKVPSRVEWTQQQQQQALLDQNTGVTQSSSAQLLNAILAQQQQAQGQ